MHYLKKKKKHNHINMSTDFDKGYKDLSNSGYLSVYFLNYTQ